MAKQCAPQVPIRSRWAFVGDASRVLVVLERKPFGLIEYREEGRACFGSCRQSDLVRNAVRVFPDAPLA